MRIEFVNKVTVLHYFILRDISARGALSPKQWADLNRVDATSAEVAFKSLRRRGFLFFNKVTEKFYCTKKANDAISDVRHYFGFHRL